MQTSIRIFSYYIRQALTRERFTDVLSVRWPLGVRGLSASSLPLPQGQSQSTNSNMYSDHDKRTLYVRDFKHSTSVSALKNAFSIYGAVEEVSVIQTDSGKSKGFGYVTFKQQESASRALEGRHLIDNRWITAQPKIQNTSFAGQTKKIRVTNVPQKITQLQLEDYFSKFGKISGVDFVTVDPVSKKRKEYCFVEFENERDASKAVETPAHVIEGFDVKVQFSTSRFKSLPETREVLVRCLPSNTTVEQLQDYFSGFGELVRVDLICKRHPKNSDTFAFLKFESPQSAKKVTESEAHSFGDRKIIVKRTSLKYPMKNRHLKLFIEDIPPQTQPREIQNYFSQFGTVKYIKNKELLWLGNATVIFALAQGVSNALSCPEHVLDGHKFRVRRLCWSKNISLFDLARDFHFKDFRKE